MLGNNFMASMIRRTKGNKKYYYLIHNTSIKQYERYLGKEIPQDIGQTKKEFEKEIFLKEKVNALKEIQKRYSIHISKADPKIIQSEYHDFKINHIYSTQKIEGSTMTYGQTKKLLEYNLSPKDTTTEHIIEAVQLEKIFDELLVTRSDMSKRLILDWHNKLFENTDTNNAGNFRRQDVGPLQGKTEYSLWPDVTQDIMDLLKWYKMNKDLNPVILAAQFHKKFETIHPFIDGNGRIGRLLVILILYKNGYPLINILPKERLTYLKKLEAAQTQNNDTIFVKWFVLKYLRDNKKYLV